MFAYLSISLAGILAFVGFKMLAEGLHHVRGLESRLPDWADPAVLWIPAEPLEMAPVWSLLVIVLFLVAGIGASLLFPAKTTAAKPGEHSPQENGNSGPQAPKDLTTAAASKQAAAGDGGSSA